MNVKLILLIIFLAALALLVLVLIAQRKKKKPSHRSIYIDALHALIRGEKKQALRLLTDAVKSGENDAGAYLMLGNLLREKGQADKALQVHMSLKVRKDLKDNEKDEVQIAIADDYFEMGKFEKAIDVLEQFSKKSRSKEVLIRLHRLFHSSKQYEKAFDMLKQLSRDSQEYSKNILASYLSSVAIETYEGGDLAGSKRFLNRALKIDRSCPPAIFFMAKLAMNEGDMNTASDMWKELLRERPDYFEDVRGYLERSLYEGGDFDAFEKMLNELLQERPGEISVACALASFYKKKGDINRAIGVLSEDVQSVHSNLAATILLADLHLEAGNDSRAKEILEKAVLNTVRKIYYKCPQCGSTSEYPLFYCTTCFSLGEFEKSYEK